MYVNDPNELAELPEVKREVILEEPRDYHEFFWDDTRNPNFGKSADSHWGIQTQVCRFNGKGEHTVMAKDCPHFEIEDEEGSKIQDGWTVQWKNT
jgi:hypothetical protein